jgi:signal transduction histidine kinase
MKELSLGDYSVRLEYKGMINEMQSFNELSTSFNKLAAELQNNQMLRSDFINNFSHEFKTPIASILGFARLLQKGELLEEEKKQYIDAIEEESRRLSSMAMNVLNLTKVEKQEILNDVSKFNLSEQIRYCVLLLEDKWIKKNISPILDFEEFAVEGNEELLMQVWINLIDNAVKFSPDNSEISLEISENENAVSVSVANGGYSIPKEKLDKIWSRFYQADESHSSEGNGIGLAIVKRVVELHSGSVSVKSDNCQTVFTVVLPKKQMEDK